MAAGTKRVRVQATGIIEIVRFDRHQIIQHASLMISFVMLVITGLPMKFFASPISQWWMSVLGGIEAARSIHHFAALVIVLVCLYHLGYILYSTLILERPFPVKMFPSYKDVIYLLQEFGYYLGLRKEMPGVDRFNWKEKFDYWAIFWGMPVMAGSGFILMFPVLATRFLPSWIVPAAYVAHSDEAMLALTWIFLVHVFFNHFSPGVFPMNTTIFTGKVPGKRYQHEHPRDYERIINDTKIGEVN